ncbi:DEAD/DEAH box helicase [Salinibacterium sp. TMP30]|uniref:DEAD/DEAH box helicase n=1 Tax=Salinibacterium sp. TMP30 TaxID=3138237 RepID=UPI00313876DA
MSELLPTLQAEDVRMGLVDYLSTTFALADEDAREALDSFLRHPENGIFKGPYVRLRLPFRPAEDGWRQSLEWHEGFPPYGHQAAAFARLSSANLGPEKTRPQPTLVTTGTGSGKTEAFLYPILDHVLRAKREGTGGIKALILYPMNALANDQARRLTELITTSPALAGVRAALYTGQTGPSRSNVTPDGLITDRKTTQDDAPDILLTNYKMLDQLLLRPADQKLWKQSATSLQYLVLDEFHTYDGAQGTDVAMLLRRLGLALKRHWPADDEAAARLGIDDDARARPLGLITPVATSATLGDKGDPSRMVEFARTVFGDEFDDDSIITETRLGLDEWADDAERRMATAGFAARAVDPPLVARIADVIDGLGDDGQREAATVTAAVLGSLYRSTGDDPEADTVGQFTDAAPELLLDAAKAHPFIRALVTAATDAVSLDTLAETLFPAGLEVTETADDRDARRANFLRSLLATLSHIRAVTGRSAASVDLHLWVRALSRVDRVAGPSVAYDWTDDGGTDELDNTDAFSSEGRPRFPAIYCRHCGRSGWGVQLGPTGYDLDTSDTDIRRNHASNSASTSRFRALIYAPREADQQDRRSAGDDTVEGLFWFDVQQRRLDIEMPSYDADDISTNVLPVLTLVGDDVDDNSQKDMCPNCLKPEGVRFLGSAISTLLSVSINTIFGDRHLDQGEKKALVFTDSVQDAAHRAGFVQSRSHVFSLRNAIREAIGDGSATLDDLAEELLRRAGDDKFRRYRLLSPELVERDTFAPFWETEKLSKVPTATMRLVRRRIKFDLAMEFGLQSRVGRTLELTGAIAAEVDGGPASRLEAIGRATVKDFETAGYLDDESGGEVSTENIVRWVRGTLERMRDRGAIQHEWFKRYLESDGDDWTLWGGRPKGQGMPAFPRDREAPAYPKVGSTHVGTNKRPSRLDTVTSARGWYAQWTRKVLDVSAADGAKLSKLLLAELAKSEIIESVSIGGSGAIAYQLSPSRILVSPVTLDDQTHEYRVLECDTCQTPVPGASTIISQLGRGPCLVGRCLGTLRLHSSGTNYYRDQYNDGDIRRVVAREHTSLLKDDVRLAYENGFKASIDRPDAPNVLVATPTLEMGIDIGDLSAVFLAGLPRSVASYLQRVGRAGRLTGNSLTMAFVVGRGDQLPKLGEPLSVINGQVRPPATYLNAEEILRRQYSASVIDRLSAEGKTGMVAVARDVLATTSEKSFLATVITDAETNAAEYLTAFLSTFDHVDATSADVLTGWATPSDEPRSSSFAQTLIGACARWNLEIETLGHRRKAIMESLPALQTQADHPAATDDDKVALRSAKASLKMVDRQLFELRTEHWVAALERFGVLPNYTLLDDSVRLDVSLSWIDPESQEFQHDSISYDRGAGIAIRELAPGATFYAQGVEIRIDAVDLGSDGARIQSWVYCPECGYAHDAGVPAEGANTNGPASCPRCESPGIADANQRFDVVELEQVSAEVRRDESSISDSREERQRESFSVQIAADIDPANVTQQWYVEESGFGVKYMRELTIRWLNLGKQGGAGAPRMIAGEELSPPLFRVCEACGKLDQKGEINSAREHRAWCRYRNSKTEHTRQLALSRTLRTQGVLLRIPNSITIGDGLGLPSITAALQLGLREVIGGDPDHLRLATIVEPLLGNDFNNTAILIHDAVPGGTGYLADLANHNKIRNILELAWKIVATCECRNEGRSACHRCLLPFAPAGDLNNVSRASAERSLRLILGIDDEGVGDDWAITEVDPGTQDPESMLEQWFRKVFKDRAAALGATIKEIPSEWGNRLQITLPNSKLVWRLEPQPSLGFTRPDFVLEPLGGGGTKLAIYTDGRKYHASPQHNVLAQDAEKRRGLRAKGYFVLGITYDDIMRADAGEAEPQAGWFSRDFATQFVSNFNLSPAAIDHVTANPMTQIMEWMQNPVAAKGHWVGIAEALPMLTVKPMSDFIAPIEAESSVVALAESELTGTPAEAQGNPKLWRLRFGPLVMFSRMLDGAKHPEVVLMLDDRDAAVSSEDHADAWRLWLRLSNLLGPRPEFPPTTIMTVTEAQTFEPAQHIDESFTVIGFEWEEVMALANDGDRQLVKLLSEVPDMPVPEIGSEVGDGIPLDIAWSDRKVTVTGDLQHDEISELEASGWIIVPATLEDITAALQLER